VDLDLYRGEFVVILGPSGSGKSTLLRLVAGLEPPTRGQVLLDGTGLDGRPPRDRGMAIVFQSHSLFPHLTAFDNVAFGLRLRGTGEAEVRTRVTEAARGLGIEPLLARMPEDLSGGERQRVALARALVRRPRVFLLDEPLAGVDPNQRAALRGEIRRLHRELGAITIMVTHDQVEAMTLGDRVVVMKDGWIQQVGEPLELYGRPANKFVAGFIGSPSMNFADVTIAEAGGELWAETTGFRVKVAADRAAGMRPYKGQAVTLGVRPEDIHVSSGADAPGTSFDAVVDVVEPLGSEILLDVRVGAQSMVARVDPTVRLKVHESVKLALEPERVRFFDMKTEAAIE
jgi:multiple sugar transport system ATP-binding protein